MKCMNCSDGNCDKYYKGHCDCHCHKFEATKKIVAIIQARVGSTRLPNKILLKVNGKTLLELMLARVKMAKRLDKIILAIPDTKENDVLEKLGKECEVDVFRGSEQDVLSRYYEAAKKFKVDTIVRLTSDCPLIDPRIIDNMLDTYDGKSYLSNVAKRTYPDGMDCEIFPFSYLKMANEIAVDKHNREHVTTIFYKEQFIKKYFIYKEDLSKIRLTVDYSSDFELIKVIFEHFYPCICFSMEDILVFLEKHPKTTRLNENAVGRDNLKTAMENQLK